MEITLILKNVCGIFRLYPGCEISEYFMKFINERMGANRKAFLPEDVPALRKMGFTIKVIGENRYKGE